MIHVKGSGVFTMPDSILFIKSSFGHSWYSSQIIYEGFKPSLPFESCPIYPTHDSPFFSEIRDEVFPSGISKMLESSG